MIACGTIAATHILRAQVPTTLSEDALSFYQKAIGSIRPPLKAFVYKKSGELCNHQINADSLRQHFKKELTRERISGTDIEGILVLVMVKASLNTDEELKGLVMAISRGEIKIRKSENPSQAVPVNNSGNRLSSEAVEDLAQTRLQNLMKQKSQIALQTNPLFQRISGMEDAIINHLK